MFRPILALSLLALASPALADDGGMHPAMACAPEDQACIDQANRDYEAQQRARKAAPVVKEVEPEVEKVAPPVEEAEPAATPAPTVSPAPEAAPPPPEPSSRAPDPDAARETRSFYREGGLYLAVTSVGGQVRFVEAHPVEVVDRAAAGIESAELPEEDAAMLERSARAWKDLAQDGLPAALERQIRVAPVPAG